MLIDDDVHLPAHWSRIASPQRLKSDARNPVLTKGGTACIGYLLKSTGKNGIKGTLIQQAQDLKYKMSGFLRHFAGTCGSATFPHGAIIL